MADWLYNDRYYDTHSVANVTRAHGIERSIEWTIVPNGYGDLKKATE